MYSKVKDEIPFPFTNFNGCTVEVWEWIRNFILLFIMDVITFHAGIKVDPWYEKGVCALHALGRTIASVPLKEP